MAKSSPTKTRTVAPFAIEATKYERLDSVAKANHRTLTAQLRFLIDRCISEADRDAA